MKTKIVAGFVIIILLNIIMTILYFNSKNSLQEKITLLENLDQKVKFWKSENGKSNYKIQTLETKRTKDFLKIQSADSTINDLQQVVERYKKELKNQGSVVIYKEIFRVDTVFKTKYVYVGDSLVGYKTEFNLDNWVKGKIFTKKDSTEVSLDIYNEYSVIIGREKEKFLKWKSFATIESANPYMNVKDFKSYEVSLPKPKRFSVGPSVGIGFSGSSFNTYIGVGITYNIIQF